MRDALQAAVTPDQLREALEMSIADKGGMLSSGGFHREIVDAPLERGFWTIIPGSSFLDDDEPRRKNRIRTVGQHVGDEPGGGSGEDRCQRRRAGSVGVGRSSSRGPGAGVRQPLQLVRRDARVPAGPGTPPPLDDTTGGAVALRVPFSSSTPSRRIPRVEELRCHFGMDLADLADAVGVDILTVLKWERGEMGMTRMTRP